VKSGLLVRMNILISKTSLSPSIIKLPLLPSLLSSPPGLLSFCYGLSIFLFPFVVIFLRRRLNSHSHTHSSVFTSIHTR